ATPPRATIGSCIGFARRFDMKATDLLKRQHKEVKALLKEAEDCEEHDEREQLVEEIVSALKLHTAIEEQLFYPAVRSLGEKAEELIDEAYEEHHVVDLLLAEMGDGFNVDDDRYCAKITVLREL